LSYAGASHIKKCYSPQPAYSTIALVIVQIVMTLLRANAFG